MGGKMSRDKGGRVERELANAFKAAGIPAERVPLSGAAGGSFSGDLLIGNTLIAEVKARKEGAGFKTLEGWLGDNDLLILKRNNQSPMAVVPWDQLLKLLTAAGYGEDDAPDDQSIPDG